MKETIPFLRKRLTDIYGAGEARAMIGLIFHHLKGWNASDLIMNDDKELSPYIREKIDEILKRLENGEPLQYILNEAWFYGMNFYVDKRVLIPRPETSELVDLIIKEYSGRSDLRVFDIGTGSGVIAISLAKHLKFAEVEGLDVSNGALEVARKNNELLKTNVNFIEGDIFEYSLRKCYYDIIVSNPPYIAEKEKTEMERNVLEWEPELALFVPDSDPLKYYRRIAEVAMDGLKTGGKLYFEINPLYSDALKKMLEGVGFNDVDVIRDIHGRNRFAVCIKRVL